MSSQKGILRPVLVAANVILSLTAAALIILLLWNRFQPTDGNEPGTLLQGFSAIFSGSDKTQTGADTGDVADGTGEAPWSGLLGPRDIVPGELTFSMQGKDWNWEPILFMDGRYYVSEDEKISVWEPGGNSIEWVFNRADLGVDEEAKDIVFQTYARDICLAGDMAYIITWDYMEHISTLLRAPVSGGKAEYLFTLPTCAMAEADGILYLSTADALLVHDPAKGGEPDIHMHGIATVDTNVDPVIVGRDVYLLGKEGLFRYDMDGRQIYAVMSGYGTRPTDRGGEMVEGVFYYQYYDETLTLYLCAYDTHTGLTDILDGRLGEDLTSMDDLFLGYAEGGIYYAADDNSNYRRYDIATGEITDFAVEYVDWLGYGGSYDFKMQLLGTVGEYFYTNERTFIDPATGRFVEGKPLIPWDSVLDSLVDPTGVVDYYRQLAENYTAGTLLMPDGTVHNITFPEESVSE